MRLSCATRCDLVFHLRAEVMCTDIRMKKSRLLELFGPVCLLSLG